MRKYKKKSNRRSWTDMQMHMAVQCVMNDPQAVIRISEEFQVPRTTLRRKVVEFGNQKQYDEVSNEMGDVQNPTFNKPGFRRVFSDEQEQALLQYIIFMETNLLGLTSIDVRRLAFQFAEKLKINHSFDNVNGLAGKDWMQSFKIRHNLSIRKSEGTSRARANGFNKEAVNKFFILYKTVKDDNQIQDEDIHNCDETPVTTNPKKTPLVLARKGQRQVGSLTACERGKLVTAELCMSAAGRYMPPMLIFPLRNRNDQYLQGMPEGSWAEFVESGWVDMISFLKWFAKFCVFSGASPERPVMLVLDGHVTHVRNLPVIDMAREKNVHILCLPPHCTHRMQPIDVGFCKPLSDAYTHAVSEYQRASKQPMTMMKIFSMFGKAWVNVTKDNAQLAKNAFKKTGLVPYDPNVFDDSDFVNLNASFLEDSTTVSSGRGQEIARYSQIIHEIQSRPVQENVSPNVQAISNPMILNGSQRQAIATAVSFLNAAANQLSKLITPNHENIQNVIPREETVNNLDLRGIAHLLGGPDVQADRVVNPEPGPTTSLETVANTIITNDSQIETTVASVSHPSTSQATAPNGRLTNLNVDQNHVTPVTEFSSSQAPGTNGFTNVQVARSSVSSVAGPSSGRAAAANTRLTNRPKNSALIVTSDEHREALIAAQLKKANKQSQPRKRKTAEPKVCSTTKKRCSKNTLLAGQEISSTVSVNSSNRLVPENTPRRVLNLSDSVAQVITPTPRNISRGVLNLSDPVPRNIRPEEIVAPLNGRVSQVNGATLLVDLSDSNTLSIDSMPIYIQDEESVIELLDDSANASQ